MRASQSLFNTLKESQLPSVDKIEGTSFKSAQLATQAGLVRQSSAGIYDLGPMGLRIQQKIEGIIRDELEREGAVEVELPILQTANIWNESGRLKSYGESMYTLSDRKGSDFVLGPTHEEAAVDFVRSNLQSYRQLPVNIFQFGTKFRDEPRARGGLLRTKMFTMQDAYSFDVNEDALQTSYNKIQNGYHRIMDRMGLDYLVVGADSGDMGGSTSQEFMALSEAGDDLVAIRNDGSAANIETLTDIEHQNLEKKRAIEVGHIFQLGTRYSVPMNLNFTDADGNQQPVHMGCYGLGVTRLIAASIEQNHDANGMIWPESVAPFSVHILPTNMDDNEVAKTSESLYNTLQSTGIDVFLDDRKNVRAGEKFADADLVGIPHRLTIGPRSLKNGAVEYSNRKGSMKEELAVDQVLNSPLSTLYR